MEELRYQDTTIEQMKINSVMRKRTIYMNEEVTPDSMFKFCYYLDRIVEMDTIKNVSKDKLKPITVIYSSGGGSVYDGLMAIGKLEQIIGMGYKVISIIQGYAMSMAQTLALIATERQATKHSRIMIHQPTAGVYGTLKHMEENIEETNKIWDEMKSIITKYSHITNSQLDEIKKMKYDKFMWEDEALELGIIDKII